MPPGLDEAVRALASDVAQRLERGPSTLLHCDLHAENVLFDRLRPVFLDWQNASVGPLAIDVAGILSGLEPTAFAAHHRGLIALVAREAGADVEAFAHDVATALRWNFAGVVVWLVRFEAESLRDASTLQSHWRRLSQAVLTLHDGPS